MEKGRDKGTDTLQTDNVFARKEYIERGAAIKLFSFATLDCLGMEPTIRADDVVAALKSIPAADVVPVRHGRWIWNPDGMDWGLGAWCCSECESKAETWWDNDRKYNPRHCSGGHFCGNCGAIMDKDGDGD